MAARKHIIFGAAGIFLAGVLFLAAAALFFTSATGRGFILARALPVLSRALQQNIQVSEIGGAWPGEITLSGVVVADSTGRWLEIDRLNLKCKISRYCAIALPSIA